MSARTLPPTDYEQLREEGRARLPEDRLPAYLAWLDWSERVDNERPRATAPCPAWCARKPGHFYDNAMDAEPDEPIEFGRFHSDNDDDPDEPGHVSQYEHYRQGEVWLDDPVACLWETKTEDVDDPAEVRRRAQQLAAIADRLEEILKTVGPSS